MVVKTEQRSIRHTYTYKSPALIFAVICLTVPALFYVEPLPAQKTHLLDHNTLEKYRLARRLFYKGERLFIQGKYKKAEKALKDCLKNFDRYSYSDFYLGRIYYQAGDYKKALAHIERAKTSYTFFIGISASTYQEYLAQLRQQKDQLMTQVQGMKNSLANMSASATAASSRSGKYRRDLERSITDMESRIDLINHRLQTPIAKLAETPADYFYLHGNVLFRIKKFKEAYDQYLVVVQKKPKYGNAYANLANLNFMAKRYKQALQYLDQAERYGAKANPKFRDAIIKAINSQDY
jgi:tetratricopeptide (TPR) repeat protein